MSNDLYFISIIAKALEQKDADQSLKQAFEEIKSLGTKPDYEQGFEQFQQFMNTVNEQVKNKGSDNQLRIEIAKELIVELATDTFEGSDEDKKKALGIIKSNPQWREEYDKLVDEIEELSQVPAVVEILVLRDNKPFKSITFADIPGSKTIDRITAGLYNISFASGRAIWKGELTEQAIVWAKAYPGRPFDLAADTTGQEPQPVKEIDLFDGEIIIQIYPSIESGSMKITINAVRDAQ
ncbi:hypothetical protein ACFL3G_09255 [Planctomycetota bacterium]